MSDTACDGVHKQPPDAASAGTGCGGCRVRVGNRPGAGRVRRRIRWQDRDRTGHDHRDRDCDGHDHRRGRALWCARPAPRCEGAARRLGHEAHRRPGQGHAVPERPCSRHRVPRQVRLPARSRRLLRPGAGLPGLERHHVARHRRRHRHRLLLGISEPPDARRLHGARLSDPDRQHVPDAIAQHRLPSRRHPPSV